MGNTRLSTSRPKRQRYFTTAAGLFASYNRERPFLLSFLFVFRPFWLFLANMPSKDENNSQLYGTIMVPIIDEAVKNDNPYQRNHHQPPRFKTMIPLKVPLVDARPLLSDPGYKAASLLKTHGFGVVKHRSRFLEVPGHIRHKEAIFDEYCPEIEALVKETLGAKQVFIRNCIVRGELPPGEYKSPDTSPRKGLKVPQSRR